MATKTQLVSEVVDDQMYNPPPSPGSVGKSSRFATLSINQQSVSVSTEEDDTRSAPPCAGPVFRLTETVFEMKRQPDPVIVEFDAEIAPPPIIPSKLFPVTRFCMNVQLVSVKFEADEEIAAPAATWLGRAWLPLFRNVLLRTSAIPLSMINPAPRLCGGEPSAKPRVTIRPSSTTV